jgi:hypothetical protein
MVAPENIGSPGRSNRPSSRRARSSQAASPSPAAGVASSMAATPRSHGAATIPVAPIPVAFKTFRRVTRRGEPMLVISPWLCTQLPPYAVSHEASKDIVSAEYALEATDRHRVQPYVDQVSLIMRVRRSRVNDEISCRFHLSPEQSARHSVACCAARSRLPGSEP